MADRGELLAFAAALTRRRAGLALPPEPGMVEIRLAPLARREGMESAWALLAAARRQPESPLASGVVEALVPRDTWFFRDRTPFRYLAEHVLPEAFAEAVRRDGKEAVLRIWCAGCGAGQEAYSLAMLLEERHARGQPSLAQIVATDFSRTALNRARQGLYNQFEAQRGLPIRRLVEHFDKEGEDWRIAPALRRRVDFRLLNLLQDLAPLGEFDIVLLRHVLPHLAAEPRGDVLTRASARLRPEGWLMLGAWEAAPDGAADLDPAPGVPGLYRARAPRADRRVEPRAAA